MAFPPRLPLVSSPRVAVTGLFVLDGFVFGSWAARVPDVSAQVGATHASLGAVLLCVSVGALATMRPTGALCDRLGPGLVSVFSGVLLCMTTVLPGLASSVAELGAALIAFGAVTGMMNVAINSLGVSLEGAGRRPLLPLLHASFSFGGLAGSLIGGFAASVTTPVAHLLVVACTGLLATSLVARALMPGGWAPARSTEATRPGNVPTSTRTVVIALGAIAGCTAYGEGTFSDWGVLHLDVDLGASPLVAGAGYAAFCLAMGCGRLAGPHLIQRLGETRLLVYGALLAAGGTLLAALSPLIGFALLGFVLVGSGLSNMFPIAIGRAGALAGPRGVALASTVGYGGLLGAPPLIGFLAAGTSLPIALTTVSLLALVAGGLAVAVRHDQPVPVLRTTWYRAALLARPGSWLVPVGAGLRLATERHAEALTVLGHGARATTTPGSARTAGPEPYPGLEFLTNVPARG